MKNTWDSYPTPWRVDKIPGMSTQTSKDFDFTNEEFLNIIEDMGLLQQLQILQISKPN